MREGFKKNSTARESFKLIGTCNEAQQSLIVIRAPAGNQRIALNPPGRSTIDCDSMKENSVSCSLTAAN
jgi:hypothetical protein